jgi:alpha/beta superfamily hydrolase
LVDANQVSVIGYSFGAWVGSSYAQTDSRIAAIASVSMAAWHYDAEFALENEPPTLGSATWRLAPDLLQRFVGPKLLVVGDSDPFAPAWTVQKWAERLPPPIEVQVVSGTGHFYQGREIQVAELVAQFIAGL